MKILFRIFVLLPWIYWIYAMLTNQIGADPAKVLNHKMGQIAFYYILLNLFLGWLLAMSTKFQFKIPTQMRFLLTSRRYLGVVSFFYLILHVLLYLTLEGFEAKAFTQIFSKIYLIFAIIAFFIMLMLALTSNDFSVRKLGLKKWKNIHRFIYFAMIAISFHVLLIEKADLVQFGSVLIIYWLMQGVRWTRVLQEIKKSINI